MQKGYATVIIILAIASLILAGGSWAYQNNFYNIRQVNSYEDCTKAGYPILLSYPGQCNTPDGQHFVQELSGEEKKKLIPPTSEQIDLAETANWATYTEKGVAFQYPEYMQVQAQTENQIRWKANYGYKTETPYYSYNEMVLRWQTTPFLEPVIGNKISVYIRGADSAESFQTTIERIDEVKNVVTDDKVLKSYLVGCGSDCYRRQIYFEQNKVYYELFINQAGGGLSRLGDQIVASFKFSE